MVKKYLNLLGVFGLLTIIFATIYVQGLQSLRLSADDPQIQMAEDTVSKLNNNSSPGSLLGSKVDIANSLAPFIIIYDKNGKVVAGNGYIDNSIPVVPIGVLNSATPGRDNKVSWQPQSNIRIASVTSAAANYYVLSGRSLKEVEVREDRILDLTAAGYVASILLATGVFVVSATINKKK